MENNFQKINLVCVICNRKNTKFFAEKNSFNLYKCRKCDFIFVYPLPLDICSIYSKDYFTGAKKGFGYVEYDRDKAPMVDAFNYSLNIIEKFLSKKGKLLDVGAASGFFLELAKKKGWNVSGVEISEFAASQARRNGLRVITGTIEDLQNCHEVFDAITMFDVIEHLSNPTKAMLVANKLLKDNGIIAINTPDSGSLVAKIMGKRWHLLIPPEHLFIFNQKNLSKLLKNNGFEVLLAAKISKKFTVEYIARVLANWRKSVFLNKIAEFIAASFLGSASLSLNLRDNFFIIARKI